MREKPVFPKKRIDAIDALRGFALMGILIVHCLEHFESGLYPSESSVALTTLDGLIFGVVQFFFMGKAYAIFSFLFGLSFFIQMDNEAGRGIDFRGRFAWRLVLLFVLGYINGTMYLGEIFVVYAVMGMLLIPCYKIPNRWLLPFCILLLLKLPVMIRFFILLSDPELGAADPGFRTCFREMLTGTREGYQTGTFAAVLRRNLWTAQLQKWLWYFTSGTYLHIFGLFLAGLMLGRAGVHKDEHKMVRYAKKAVLIGLPLFAAAYCMNDLSSSFGFPRETGREYRSLFSSYSNLGMTMIVVGSFILGYFRLGGRKVLNALAPVGRMSLTNYMLQSLVGTFVFYHYGLFLSPHFGFTYSFLLGLVLCAGQIGFSRWWMKRYCYGPVEWLWRASTRLDFRIPFRR